MSLVLLVSFHSIPAFAAKGESSLQDEVTRTSALSAFKMVKMAFLRTTFISFEVTTSSTFYCFLEVKESRGKCVGRPRNADWLCNSRKPPCYLAKIYPEIPRAKWTGRTQSMKIDDRKSNRSIDANRCMLVNWHRLVSANR